MNDHMSPEPHWAAIEALREKVTQLEITAASEEVTLRTLSGDVADIKKQLTQITGLLQQAKGAAAFARVFFIALGGIIGAAFKTFWDHTK